MATWKRTSTTLFNSSSRNSHKHQIYYMAVKINSESEILAVLKQPLSVLVDTENRLDDILMSSPVLILGRHNISFLQMIYLSNSL